MATITSATSGNFTDTATWTGGVVPTVGDIAQISSSHVVTIDSEITCDELYSIATGYFNLVDGGIVNANVTGGGAISTPTLKASMDTAATINGNIIHTGTSNSTYVVTVVGNGSFTVNGDVTGGTGSSRVGIGISTSPVPTAFDITVNGVLTAPNTAAFAVWLNTGSGVFTVNGDQAADTLGTRINLSSPSPYTVNVEVNGTIVGPTGANVGAIDIGSNGEYYVNISGDVYYGTGSGASGIFIDGGASSKTLSVSGTVYGRANLSYGVRADSTGTYTFANVVGGASSLGYGVSLTSPGTVATVTGNCQGGVGLDAHGLFLEDFSSTLTLLGNAVAGAAGGGGSGSCGVTGSGLVILHGDSIDNEYGYRGLASNRVLLQSAANHSTSSYEFAGYDLFGLPNPGTPYDFVSADAAGYPLESDVREGTSYAADTKTGTLAVPDPNSVASGVPTDDTVGGAALSQDTLVSVLGAQIAAALTAPPS